MKIDLLTIFPDYFESILKFGMIRQGIRKGLTEISTVDLREFTEDRHRTVDDRPFGGGEGMVLKPEPVFRAVEHCNVVRAETSRVILLSPRGPKFDQGKAKELSLKAHLVLICGRYEGVDQRVADALVDEELSVGDYILSGGELAAAIVVDSVCRLIPGVLGDGRSALSESFMEGVLDYPQYTRPAEYRGLRVPGVLLSGDHSAIRKWREEQALEITRSRRPDLLEAFREK